MLSARICPKESRYRSLQILLFAVMLVTLIAVTWWTFAPGITGSLIFDDIPNFKPWRFLGDIHSWSSFWSFINSSLYLPGRPLSLASFLIDDQSWPADTHLLKRTNILLHIINMLLVSWLSYRIFHRIRMSERQCMGWAIATALLWGLAPIQVSAVSYIIQRMVVLAATFSLLALLAIDHGLASIQKSGKGLAWILIGSFLLAPLGVLCKENAILTGLLGGCIFVILFPEIPRTKRTVILTCLLIPGIATFVYSAIATLTGPYGTGRDFSALQRMLSEPRVMWDYIHSILLPSLKGHSLFQEDYPVSINLFAPWTTIPALIGLISLIYVTVRLRKRLPLCSLGLAFFMTGHLLESTFLPLEIYFEHRNYLPSLGLWWAMIAAIQAMPQKLQKVGIIGAAALTLLSLSEAHILAQSWGNSKILAALWYEENPHSERTEIFYINTMAALGRQDELTKTLHKARQIHPMSLGIALTEASYFCQMLRNPPSMNELIALAGIASYSASAIVGLDSLARCPISRNEDLSHIYIPLLKNPHYGDRATQAFLWGQWAEYLRRRNDLSRARKAYRQAFWAQPQLDPGLTNALGQLSVGDLVGASEDLDWLLNHTSRIDRIRHSADFRNAEKLHQGIKILETAKNEHHH